MQYKPTRSLCATVAIAATLALGSTTYAQETAPVVAVPAAPAPVAASAPAAAPTISVPPVTVQPIAPQPVAEAAPEPAARQAPAPRARAERAAPAERPAPRPAAAPVAAAPAAPVAPVEPIAQAPLDTAAPAPVVEPASVTPGSVEGTDNGLTGEEIGFLALLAAIGLGGIAFLMTRKRRRASLADAEMVEAVEYAADPVAEPQPTLKPPVTLAATTVRARPTYDAPVVRPDAVRAEPVYATTDHPGLPDMAEPSATPSMVSMVAPRSTAPAESVLPSGEAPHGEDRNQLLDRMMNAEPDEANPFTSKKARRRRARLILQRLEAEQGGEQGEPFDWRTYESPESSSQRRREPELA